MSRSQTLFALLVIAGFCVSPALAQEADKNEGQASKSITALSRIPAAIHDALGGRDYQQAVELIDAELKTENAPAADYLTYLKGRAQTELGAFDEAQATFTALEQKFPQSRWLARSRFGRADVLVRLRDYRAAGRIYEAEARRLLSDDRKDELVEIYLEFADRYFEGVPSKDPAEKKKPDYQQALTYYQQAQQLQTSLARRQKIEFRIARCQQELGKHGEAIAGYQAFLKTHAADETPADHRAAAKMEVEVRYQLGRAQLAAGQAVQARSTWQDFLKDETARAHAGDLLAEAAYRLAHTYGVPQPGSIADLELGVAAAERFLKEFPNHKLAPQAEYEIAQSYIHHGRHEQAVARLKALIANDAYAESDRVAEARRLLGQSFAAQKKFTEAIAAWREFLDEHPTHGNWSDVQRQIIDVEYTMGEEQRQQKNYAAARNLWSTFLNKYPLDSRAAQILFYFGQMKYAEGVAAEDDEKDDDAQEATSLFEAAIADWKRLVSKYSNSEQASHAAYMIGVTLEDELGRLAEALKAYEQVSGKFADAAKLRIANLNARQLEIVTERKFRSNEKPVVKLTTRNLEKVTVKLYPIDMLDYFRKMHLASGVESLDIALIDPEKSWEYEVPNFEQYRRVENEIEIPATGPGVTAVTIAGEKLEATTMVVVSDLDVIVKSSRNELFVFAENMRTGEPAKAVSLLVSDGSKVFAEETTGDDGVLQKSYEQLKTIEDLRVFAALEGHAASTVSSLQGLDFAVGLSPKGLLYTDRPAYRAGQLVHVKGIIRWVEADRYTFKEGEKYQLDVYDSRGRVVHTKEVALGKFGTLADNFALPETSPQGSYRIHLHQPRGKQAYEANFQVHEYQLEPVQIVIDVPQDVFYRRETIAGKATLRYYYGTPLSGRTLQYRLADGPWQTAETDDKGQIEFKFETERFQESQPLTLLVQYPERNLGMGKTLYLATRGFEVGVSTLRNVMIAGETFDATVAVRDPAGEPVAVDLKLEVFEQTRVNGKTGERLVETHELKSKEEDGTDRQTLRIEQAGKYILRATGTDRFGNPVSGQHRVLISGDDDQTRLRILADRHHYSVGDTARVQLHWRNEPALALVTYEGATVLGYRLVSLKTGANELQVPLETHLAPNFVLGVAVMEHNRFHQARSEFRLTRKLNIALNPNATTLKPGDEVKVEITVTDPQGQPVAAELSLGLIQKNLLERFGGNQTVINEFFGGGYRKPSVRAATSCTFEYKPTTQGISKYLLAEEQRQKILEMELAAGERAMAEIVAIRRAEFDATGPLPRLPALDFRRTGLASAEFEGLKNRYTELLRAGRHEEAERVANMAKKLVEQLSTSGRSQVLEEELMGYAGAPADDSDGNAAVDKLFSFHIGVDENRHSDEGTSYTRNSGPMGRRFGYQSNSEFNYRIDPSAGSSQTGNRNSLGFSTPYRTHGGVIGGEPSEEHNIAQGMGGGAPNRPGTNAAGDWGAFGGPGGTGADFTQLIDLIQQEQTGPWSRINQITDGSELSLIIRQSQNVNGNGDLLIDISNFDDTLVALNDAGEFQVVNGLPVARLQELAGEGLKLLPHLATSETAFWDPVVVTDEKGKATVTFRLPNRSTAWTLQATGTDADTLTGQADAELVSKKELFAELKTPLAFTDGDKAQLLVEVHNSVVEADAEITVQLKSTIGDRAVEAKQTIKSTGPGIQEVTFPVEITAGESVKFEVSVSAGEHNDAAELTVPIQPYGVEVFATAGGSAAQNTIAFVQHDEKLPVENPKLEIVIGPSINRTLLDAVLGSGLSAYECSLVLPRSGLDRSISDALGGVAMLNTIRKSKETDSPEAQAISGRVQAAVSQLVSAQRDDGGWSWSGRVAAEKPDRFLSSRAVWALSAARSSGFAVPQQTFDQAITFLKSAFSNTSQADREGQAIILHGLTEAGAGDFALANRLYRERNNLSPSGLLHVSLIFAKLDRKETAKELLDLVSMPTDPKTANRQPAGEWLGKLTPAMQDGVELRALYLLAIEAVEPAHAKAAQLAEWLLAARRGSRWAPEKVNGPAIAALADWFARTKHVDEKYTLSVLVNNRPVEETIEIDPAVDASRRLEVPAELLVKEGPQQINFDIEGRGRFSYSVVMSGFVPADKLASTTNDWRVTRTYEPAQRMLDGEYIPRGFGVLAGRYTPFKNPLTQLPLGERGEVTLSIDRIDARMASSDEQLAYLIVTEPIPAGATVLADSIRGSFERYELAPGAITFYIGDSRNPGDIQYTLVGYLPGEYRAVATVVRSFYRPDQMAVAEAKQLAVLARGEKSEDEYKLSPVELYEFGKRLAAKKEHEPAHGHLLELFRNHRLQETTYAEVVQLLFRTSLALNRHDEIVRYFEIIKERYPSVKVDFASIMQVADAYHELGEYERAYLVYRSTIEGSFEREIQIAGFLDDRGEFLRSVEVTERLLGDYPAESYIATATYSLAHQVYGKAAGAAGDKKLRDAKITRVDLIAASNHMLEHFLSTWSKDPAADQAGFSLATALLDLEQYQAAIDRSEKFAERYADSELLDSFWYVIGYSQFALGKHEAALEMCEKVAETMRKDPKTGVESEAVNKWQAIYIMGQVHHSLGQPAQAIEEYQRVKTRFADAAEAIDFFTHKEIKLPEVTTVKPNKPAEVPLKFRNVASANVKVYRIDLLKFGLMQRNLDRITAINLAGIRPYHELDMKLGDGLDYEDREQPLNLPLKDEGAYLVVCRGENLYASGLVLVSPLELEIQEDAQSGRVRVTVKDAVDDRYTRDVHVKVIGSANDDFTSGETDLRGIFVADAVRGTSTVIAKADDNRYAFFRGKLPLGNVPANQPPAGEDAAEKKPGEKPANKGNNELLKNVIEQQDLNNRINVDNYRSIIRNDNGGAVEASDAF